MVRTRAAVLGTGKPPLCFEGPRQAHPGHRGDCSEFRPAGQGLPLHPRAPSAPVPRAAMGSDGVTGAEPGGDTSHRRPEPVTWPVFACTAASCSRTSERPWLKDFVCGQIDGFSSWETEVASWPSQVS